MEEKSFFENYIPALETALVNETINNDYFIYGPNWYIDDKVIRNQVDVFEETNYEKYQLFFDLVALYFDAKSHNFTEVDGIDIYSYKLKLKTFIDAYKKEFNIPI